MSGVFSYCKSDIYPTHEQADKLFFQTKYSEHRTGSQEIIVLNCFYINLVLY